MYSLIGQEIPDKGLPGISKPTALTQKQTGKIWAIDQADNGLLYMASDNGLVEYDGNETRLFEGSIGITRSLRVVSDSLIFTGSDHDFGHWRRSGFEWEYESLYPFKEEVVGQNEEFWGVYALEEKIIFVSGYNLYTYKNNQFTKIAAPSRFTFHEWIDNTLYLEDESEGLYTFNGISLQKIVSRQDAEPWELVGGYKDEQTTFMVGRKGIYRLSQKQLVPIQQAVSKDLIENQVFSFQKMGDWFVFGTILDGVYITDRQGAPQKHLTKRSGLPNNTILASFYSDLTHELWLSTDAGIVRVDFGDKTGYFPDFIGTFGTGKTAVLSENIFYLGTNQGLYTADWDALSNYPEQNPFRLVSGSQGQVWSLKVLENKVICGHDKGLFQATPTTFKQLNQSPGVWDILPYGNNLVLTGTYDGIQILKKDPDWIFLKKMEEVYGSCNKLLLEDSELLWVHIPNFGFLRIKLDENADVLEKTIFRDTLFEGVPQELFLREGAVCIKTNRQLYTFQPVENTFESAELPKPDLATTKMDLNSEYYFYPAVNGFALRKADANIEKAPSVDLLMRSVEAFDAEFSQSVQNDESIAYANNNLRFSFVLPMADEVEYQYRLDEATGWSPWQNEGMVHFNNISIGAHTFYVRARHPAFEKQWNAQFSFKIEAPYYRSTLAWLLYGVLLLLIYFGVRKFQAIRKEKIARQQAEAEKYTRRLEEEEKNRELLLQKNKVLEEEKGVLKQEVRSKTIELARKAKENEDKNRLLHRLKEKLEEIEKKPAVSKKRWTEMYRLLDSYLEIEDSIFQLQIEELHKEFFETLKTQFPDLSVNDFRLCAYIKTGISSKEIAEIMQVRPSSIYVSRSRLRKKLNLGTDEDLYNFLNNLNSISD